MQLKNQPTLYTIQPQATTTDSLTTPVPSDSNETTLMIMLTFCIWLLRQQMKDQ
jgi:hypothetical protein